ncbi:unnamed protein product [Camellia sinensis]
MNPTERVAGDEFMPKKKIKTAKQPVLDDRGVLDGELLFDAANVHSGGVRLWQALRVFFDAVDVYSSGDRLWQAS